MPSSSYKSKNHFLGSKIFDNFSYKLVALFIAFVLWISILGRRDFVSTRELELNFVTAPGYTVLSQSVDHIRIKISGQQPLMKKFKESIHVITVDVTNKDVGLHDLDVTASQIELPEGLRVLNIRPNSVKFEIIKKSEF